MTTNARGIKRVRRFFRLTVAFKMPYSLYILFGSVDRRVSLKQHKY